MTCPEYDRLRAAVLVWLAALKSGTRKQIHEAEADVKRILDDDRRSGE